MSSPDKNIGPWSMEDVHKYLRKELSDSEMHRLEKAALDDPFLADALEGLATTPALGKDLSDLRTRLDARVAEKETRLHLLPRIRVAAAVILLVGLGTAGWFALRTQRTAKPGLVKTAPAATAPDAGVASSQLASPGATAPAISTPAAKTTAATASASAAPAITDKEPSLAKAESPAQTRRGQTADTTTSNADSIGSVADAVMAPAAKYRFAPPALPAESLLYSGKVLDVNNHPLAGVSLVLEGKSKGTVTDGEGYFKIYVPPGDTLRKLNADVAGFDETSVALNNENRLGNFITLKEHRTILNEVVVSGVGEKRKETMAAPPSDERENLDSGWTRASPAVGRIAYLDYLATAKKGLGADSTIHGTVSISFLVDQKGKLTDFKIEQSLSPVHDAGTIRMITEGSPWKLIRGKKDRLLVSVSFP